MYIAPTIALARSVPTRLDRWQREEHGPLRRRQNEMIVSMLAHASYSGMHTQESVVGVQTRCHNIRTNVAPLTFVHTNLVGYET